LGAVQGGEGRFHAELALSSAALRRGLLRGGEGEEAD